MKQALKRLRSIESINGSINFCCGFALSQELKASREYGAPKPKGNLLTSSKPTNLINLIELSYDVQTRDNIKT